jgi:dTDP-4-amino-4,6-dideoxygalactose transaminase
MIRLAKPWITDAEKQAVAEVLDSGWLADGEKVTEFERMLAKYVGVKHAIVVPNATLGLELAVRSLGVRGRVGVPAFTHPATALAPSRAGCRVGFFDVAPNGNTDGQYIAEFCDRHSPSAVIPVSWGGTALGEDVYLNATAYDVPVIEDCACGLGAINSAGQKAGSVADVSVVSFHPRKIITTGEGGALLTNRGDVAEYARDAKNFCGSAGTNLKMSDVNAAIGIVQLQRIDEIIADRRRLASLYEEELHHAWIHTWYPVVRGSEFRTYQTYCIDIPNRDRVITRMRQAGIETQVGTYYVPHAPGWFSRSAWRLARDLLALPMHYEVSESDVERIVETLVEALK